MKFKQFLIKIFFLPLPLTFVIAIFGFGFVLSVAIFDITSAAVQYLSYFSSAYALVVTITAIPRFVKFVKNAKKHIKENTAFGRRFFSDIHFRTEIYLLCGLFINFLYIAIKLFFGIYYHSIWFITLAVYYIVLVIMRFIILHKGKTKSISPNSTGKTPIEIELKRYRLCGIMLLLMNQALMGIVIFIVRENQGFVYPGVLIYAMAAYSFYSITIAIVNVIRFKKHGSPLLSAAKVINLVTAMVSILAMEVAMLAQFGGDNDYVFRRLMTSLTGGAVCLIVIVMAIFMIWKSTKQLKNLKINKTET